ncbi:IGF-like family receptor 1 [Anableps anableps]
MRLSDKCHDLTTYWDRYRKECVPCERKPEYEVEPNCGRDDYGGIHSDKFKKCEANTFNDGSSAYCKNCSPCPPGLSVLKPCTLSNDTICQAQRDESTTAALSKSITTHATTPFSPAASTQTYTRDTLLERDSLQNAPLWAVPILITVFFLVVAAVCALKMKKGRGVCKKVFYKRKTSYQNEGFSLISSSGTSSEVLKGVLNANTLSAPLHTVLDDLDVLEELVILLDPDTQGIKSTKHLASHCSFPSTWITYTYSMKDSRSPLKAVLEGVTSKQPDWTVGHLAKLLRQMGRNDAIAVLAKLRPGPNDACV